MEQIAGHGVPCHQHATALMVSDVGQDLSVNSSLKCGKKHLSNVGGGLTPYRHKAVIGQPVLPCAYRAVAARGKPEPSLRRRFRRPLR